MWGVSQASLRLHMPRDSQLPSTSLVTGLFWLLFAFSRAGKGCSHHSRRVPCPPATPQPTSPRRRSHHIRKAHSQERPLPGVQAPAASLH